MLPPEAHDVRDRGDESLIHGDPPDPITPTCADDGDGDPPGPISDEDNNPTGVIGGRDGDPPGPMRRKDSDPHGPIKTAGDTLVGTIKDPRGPIGDPLLTVSGDTMTWMISGV